MAIYQCFISTAGAHIKKVKKKIMLSLTVPFALKLLWEAQTATITTNNTTTLNTQF